MARHEDYMMTAEELRLRRERRRRWIVYSVIFLVGLALAVLLAKPTRNVIKGWQARRHATKAFEAIEQQHWDTARVEAVAAYQLRESEPEALRAVARLLSRTGQADALDFWKRLEKQAPLAPGDRRDEVAVALSTGDLVTAEQDLQTLLARDSFVTSQDWLLAAQLYVAKGEPEAALPYTDRVLRSPHLSEREQLQAALLALNASNALAPDQAQKRQKESWDRITLLAKRESQTSVDALLIVARLSLSLRTDSAEWSAETASQIAKALTTHPLAKAPHKLLALDLQIHADETRRETLIARGIAEWKDAPPDDLAVLSEWLNSKQEFERNLATIPLEKALGNKDLFLQHLDALGALARWDEVKQLLVSERFPLDPVIQQMYLARCSAQLGEKTATGNYWQRSLDAAGGDAQKLLALGTYAEKNGALQTAEAAYHRAVAEAPKLRLAQQGRLRIAQASRNTRKIHGVLADMLRLWPNDIAIQNDEGYTRLLLMPTRAAEAGTSASLEAADKAGAEQIVKLGEALVAREPRSLPHRTLLALARLRAGHLTAALDAYGIEVPEKAVTPSAVAVRAATLAANGQRDQARSLVADVPPDRFVPEERALIEAL